MHATRLAAASLAATAVTLAAPAGHAATLTQTFTTLASAFIGFAPPGSSTDTFILANDTGATWRSFRLQVTPGGAEITGGFSGPTGSFAIIDNDGPAPTALVLGILVPDGDDLTFTLSSFSNSFLRFFDGTPGTEGIARPVPLPAAAWALLGGLGALGAVAGRRRGA